MDEKIEKVIELAGNKGRYQIINEILIVLIWMNCNVISVSLAFLEKTPEISYINNKGETVTERLDYDLCDELNGNYNITKYEKYSWAYDLDISCDSTKIGLIGTIAFLGLMCGNISNDLFQKLFGQKKLVVGSMILFGLITILNIFINTYIFYLLVCFFSGFFCNLASMTVFMISEETIHKNLRALFGAITNCGYPFGGIYFIILYWKVENWKTVMYITFGLNLFILILIIFILRESPRALLYKDYEQALYSLRFIAKFNGRLDEFNKAINSPEYIGIINDLKKLSSNQKMEEIKINYVTEKKEERANSEMLTLPQQSNRETMKNKKKIDIEVKNTEYTEENVENKIEIQKKDKIEGKKVENNINQNKKEVKKISFIALFIYPSIRWKFLAMNLIWFITAGVYHGLTIGIKDLPGNVYITGILLFMAEIISNFLSAIFMNIKSLGRKKNCIINFILGGIAAFCLFLLLKYDTAAIVFYIFIRLFITIPNNMFYTYCLEIYPTQIRALAFSINTGFNSIGGVVIPIIIEKIKPKFVYLIFTFICAICAIGFMFLEETVGKPMRETIKELEDKESNENEEIKEKNINDMNKKGDDNENV